MAIAHAHLAPWAPGSNLAVRVNRAIVYFKHFNLHSRTAIDG